MTATDNAAYIVLCTVVPAKSYNGAHAQIHYANLHEWHAQAAETPGSWPSASVLANSVLFVYAKLEGSSSRKVEISFRH